MKGDQARMRRLGLLAGLALGLAAQTLPAHAAGDFTPPKGCTGFLTVQMHGCLVSNHYRCQGDPKGDQWRVDFNADGPVFVSRIDYETEWVESYDLGAGTHEVLQKPSKQPASFSKLLATGADSYDFTTATDDGKIQHVTGTDKLTGKSEVISGVKLEQTEFDTKETDANGKMIWHSKGQEWINRDWRLFLAGTGVWEDDQGKVPYNNSPMLLLQKGQKGFMSTTPEFDCNSVMSELVLPPKRAVE
jgi:hypothetical protein